ncbi:hypothetical protein MD588_06790 [Photobacterium sp. SDRW27]|uniref:hypothetical protein n=1 Tax=Photobacterium obscurum TaxID=2829490 RepID=UPI002244D422|nr:hypothetical protein [Photobacterium obscurum]MCW8328510.1 hypothetical protein [Photobacterium obscurum]
MINKQKIKFRHPVPFSDLSERYQCERDSWRPRIIDTNYFYDGEIGENELGSTSDWIEIIFHTLTSSVLGLHKNHRRKHTLQEWFERIRIGSLDPTYGNVLKAASGTRENADDAPHVGYDFPPVPVGPALPVMHAEGLRVEAWPEYDGYGNLRSKRLDRMLEISGQQRVSGYRYQLSPYRNFHGTTTRIYHLRYQGKLPLDNVEQVYQHINKLADSCLDEVLNTYVEPVREQNIRGGYQINRSSLLPLCQCMPSMRICNLYVLAEERGQKATSHFNQVLDHRLKINNWEYSIEQDYKMDHQVVDSDGNPEQRITWLYRIKSIQKKADDPVNEVYLFVHYLKLRQSLDILEAVLAEHFRDFLPEAPDQDVKLHRDYRYLRPKLAGAIQEVRKHRREAETSGLTDWGNVLYLLDKTEQELLAETEKNNIARRGGKDFILTTWKRLRILIENVIRAEQCTPPPSDYARADAALTELGRALGRGYSYSLFRPDDNEPRLVASTAALLPLALDEAAVSTKIDQILECSEGRGFIDLEIRLRQGDSEINLVVEAKRVQGSPDDPVSKWCDVLSASAQAAEAQNHCYLYQRDGVPVVLLYAQGLPISQVKTVLHGVAENVCSQRDEFETSRIRLLYEIGERWHCDVAEIDTPKGILYLIVVPIPLLSPSQEGQKVKKGGRQTLVYR